MVRAHGEPVRLPWGAWGLELCASCGEECQMEPGQHPTGEGTDCTRSGWVGGWVGGAHTSSQFGAP